MAANRGIPFVIGEPKMEITEAVLKLARDLAGIPVEKKAKPGGLGWRLLGGK
jgi:MinD-like ATPase involved in chromosome partitioning or flagellar assembly